MTEISALFAFILLVGSVVLVLAAILMPFAVFAISDRLKRVEKILASMEHMMRHGKD